MIRLSGVHKTYRSRQRTTHVIKGIDLDIGTGAFFTLLGKSGSGKTTTLRVIAGLEKSDSGQVWLGDRLVSDPARGVFVPANERGIGMVFQSYAIWPNMTVFENVAYPLRIATRNRDRRDIRVAVGEALDLVGLKDLATSPATALSGGQQQRVAFARAVADRPRILLLDEPLSNLDAQLRERMRIEVRDLLAHLGTTAVYVTHDRAEALSMSSTVALMRDGGIEALGPPAELYGRPATAFTAEFLGLCNLVRGEVVEAGQGTYRVATPNGPLSVSGPPGCGPGQAVTVVVRPEDVSLLADPSGPGWTGRISRTAYYGDRVECGVAMAQGDLVVNAHPSLDLPVGKPVGIAVDERRCWVIPDRGSA